ncbi:MAG: c-type cytochrome [Arcobacteraceae bacterium]|nr:c-type cytochrome [Arcobacteraceae bacterium]
MADGKNIYLSKCQSCHGAKADKEAYNKSRALNSLTLQEIQAALRGYREDMYDRGLAIMMKPYASILMDNEEEAVYNYIQTLK